MHLAPDIFIFLKFRIRTKDPSHFNLMEYTFFYSFQERSLSVSLLRINEGNTSFSVSYTWRLNCYLYRKIPLTHHSTCKTNVWWSNAVTLAIDFVVSVKNSFLLTQVSSCRWTNISDLSQFLTKQ